MGVFESRACPPLERHEALTGQRELNRPARAVLAGWAIVRVFLLDFAIVWNRAGTNVAFRAPSAPRREPQAW